jgi:putative endopeptidase
MLTAIHMQSKTKTGTPMKHVILFAVAFVLCVADTSFASDKNDFGPWGYDLTARDTSVKPGDDFFEHANGAYLKRTVIPDDQSSTGGGRDVHNSTQEQLRTLIESSAAHPKPGVSRQIGDMFKSFMDESRVEQLDAMPLKADIARIDAIGDTAALVQLLAGNRGRFGRSFVVLQAYADATKPISSLYMGQDGFGMPDRDYYLKDQFKDTRAAYLAYLTRTMQMLARPNSEKAAADILAFETKLAEASWSAEERGDLNKIINPMTVSALQSFAPAINWRSYLDASGARGVNDLVLMETTAVKRLAEILVSTPLDTLKAWAIFHTTDAASPYLPHRFVDSRFEFREKALFGIQSQRLRWKRGVRLISSTMGEALGRAYVDKHFPASSRSAMEKMVANLKNAMATRLQGLAWMDASTRREALAKLKKMNVMVGYPAKWRSYSKLRIDPTDLYGNVQRSSDFEWNYQIAKVGKPIDLQAWDMTPQTVDAYNGGLENKIVFPAGLLQPPFYNPKADAAVNYGAVGAIIGHEIIHGFDDQGRKIDADGRLRDWWTAEDAERFTAEADKLARQYDAYEPLPGLHINGKLTLGENIADLGGLVIALDAYHASLGGKPAPVIDGLTGDQRLLLAYAQAWRGKQRDDDVKDQVASDPHSPQKFRVIGPTRNIDTWYDAFGVKPGDTNYLKPEERVRLW